MSPKSKIMWNIFVLFEKTIFKKFAYIYLNLLFVWVLQNLTFVIIICASSTENYKSDILFILSLSYI